MTKHNHKILFILAYVGMPVLMAWLGYAFSNYEVAKKAQDATQENSVYRHDPNSTLAFYDLPRVSLSMASNAGGSGMMKLDLSLVVQRSDLQRVVDFEPRIVEKILMFMRQQSYESYQQPNGARELRRGLEHEIRTGAFPVQVAEVDVRKMVFGY